MVAMGGADVITFHSRCWRKEVKTLDKKYVIGLKYFGIKLDEKT